MKRLALIIVLALSLTSCGDPPPKEGTVIDREFVRAHTETEWVTHYRTEYYTETQCTSEYDDYTKSYRQSCRPVSQTRSVPYQVLEDRYVPDDYNLKLNTCTTKEGEEEKCKTRWVDVREGVYDDCQIGEYWREESACRHK